MAAKNAKLERLENLLGMIERAVAPMPTLVAFAPLTENPLTRRFDPAADITLTAEEQAAAENGQPIFVFEEVEDGSEQRSPADAA